MSFPHTFEVKLQTRAFGKKKSKTLTVHHFTILVDENTDLEETFNRFREALTKDTVETIVTQVYPNWKEE